MANLFGFYGKILFADNVESRFLINMFTLARKFGDIALNVKV
jgi:hypothetical protein